MKKILARLYSLYGMFIFMLTAAFFMMPQLILAQRTQWHRIALRINHYWAWTFFSLCFIRVKIEPKYQPDPGKQYIICANHFSYLDIPSMGLIPAPFKFIGKSSLTRVPLFGYMFRKIHVPVDRDKLNSRALSLKQAMKEISNGFNMMFFPEGGVLTSNAPQMIPFRDGAFRLAAKYQLPILPVVMHDNYKIVPDDGKFLLYRHTLRISILPPLFPEGQHESEIAKLKLQTQRRIQLELDRNH